MTPITSQFDKLENITQQIKIIEKEKEKQVRWELPSQENNSNNSKNVGDKYRRRRNKGRQEEAYHLRYMTQAQHQAAE